MRRWFDKDAKSKSFSPGDKVLVLLPILGSSLQARYSGPYMSKRRWLIETTSLTPLNVNCKVGCVILIC